MRQGETSTRRLGAALGSSRYLGRVLSAGLVVGVALLLVLAAIAQGGEYHVYSCSDPLTGRPLPVYDWTGERGPTTNSCATNPVAGGLGVDAIAQFGPTQATWTFTAPADTHIVAARLYRSAEANYRALAYWASPANEYTSSNAFDSCQGSSEHSACTLGNTKASSCEPVSCYSPSDVLDVPAAHLPSLRLSLSMRCFYGCGGSETLHSADITLEQDFSPTGSATGGSLTTQPILQGVEDINISASDPGSGVFQAIFEIDGKVLAAQTIDTNGGSCQPYRTAQDGTNVFLNPQPCPQSVTAVDVPFNTALVPDGSHQLTVVVSDVAGNTTSILTRTVAFNNSGEYTLQVQRQEQAEHQAQELMTRGVCKPPVTTMPHFKPPRQARPAGLHPPLRRLGPDSGGPAGRSPGAPIAGAEIELRQQPSYLGAEVVLIATTKTDRSGNWRFRVRNGPSRVLTVGYRSHSKDSGYAAQLSYREKVLAPVTLWAPRQVRPGRGFDFRGELAGGYVSPGGVLVSLEIHYGGEWREIALLRRKAIGAPSPTGTRLPRSNPPPTTSARSYRLPSSIRSHRPPVEPRRSSSSRDEPVAPLGPPHGGDTARRPTDGDGGRLVRDGAAADARAGRLGRAFPSLFLYRSGDAGSTPDRWLG